MSNTAKFTVLFLAFFFGFVIGYRGCQKPEKIKEVVVVDTIVQFDTVVREKLVPKISYIDRWDTVEVRTTEHDTVLAELPIEKKVYEEDSVYRAVVSGYKPSLDSLIVWNKTTTVTIDRTKTLPAPKWSFGVTAGPSVLITPNGKVYGGAGVTGGITYRF